MATISQKPVLISGAGIGGTLLARALQSHNIPFQLYERDANRHARAQGYRIRMSDEGLSAIESVLNSEDFTTFKDGTSTTGSGGPYHFDAKTGDRIEHGSTGPPGPPPSKPDTNSAPHAPDAPAPTKPMLSGPTYGTARGWLRDNLLTTIADSIHWDKRASSYSLTESGVVLNFTDSTTSPEGSMLVIADGSQSALAAQLGQGEIRSYDTGARMIHGQTTSKAFRELGTGVFFVRDGSHEAGPLSLITNIRPGGELDDDSVEFGWVFVGGPGSFAPPNEDFSLIGEPAAELSRELTKDWSPKFKGIFEQQNDAQAAFLKMSTAWPRGLPEWKSEARVTVLGDAVHCMTPAGGVGANTALQDAAFLGKLLGERGGWGEDVVAKYEIEMRQYASEKVKASFEAAAKQFSITELGGKKLDP
nr:hypothetical protein B0A51_10825 [Rachicladosporium sp. CCFEE 5018]